MATPRTVEEYLGSLPARERAVLEKVRATIRRAAPSAVETIRYGIPTFQEGGRLLLSFAAFRDHCSLFPASGLVRDRLGAEIEPYVAGKATIRFTTERPIPAALVRKVVKARLEENAAGH